MPNFRNLSGALLFAVEIFFGAGARAEPPALVDNPGPIDEIVVTAQKRTSTIQTTPISITAVTGEDLRSRGVASFAALAQGTPGVSLKSEGPSQTEIEMRGMTSSGGNSATVGSGHRHTLPTFRYRGTADRFTDGLQPQCELPLRIVRPDLEYRAVDPQLHSG
jgi:outer membrane receptor protein involved in Fe transport